EMYNSEVVLNSAMTTKLLRNSFLILLIPLISYLYNKNENVEIKSSIKSFFPFFVVGFIIFSFFRTIGDELIISSNLIYYWEYFLIFVKDISKYCILLAMVALGLQTNLKSMSKLGLKPLAIGFIASASVGIFSILFLQYFYSH
ncbi:putative sulfate exporter family transporter, partial [Alphaproteobacteria bacterium]|nr:putative sulfate exporter family transporter [Alphaproteobacteria bacterium]